MARSKSARPRGGAPGPGCEAPPGGARPSPGRSGLAPRRTWDSICHRCGQCCYVRRLTPTGLQVDTGAPCRFLDEDSRLCTVYERRFRVCSECRKVTILHALFSPYLPRSCGYVQAFRHAPRLEGVLRVAAGWLLGRRGAELSSLGALRFVGIKAASRSGTRAGEPGSPIP